MAGSSVRTRNDAKKEAAKETSDDQTENVAENNQESCEDDLYRFVVCSICKLRLLFGSAGIDLPYQEVVKEGVAIVCRCCRLQSKFDQRLTAINELVEGLLEEKAELESDLKNTKAALQASEQRVQDLENLVKGVLPDEEVGESEAQEGAGKKKSYASIAAAGLAGKATSSKLITVDMCSVLVTKTLEELEQRKTNIILYNVPESMEGKKRDEVRKHDQDGVSQVLEQINVTDEVKPVNFFRLGRREEGNHHPRPLLVKVRSQSERDLVLQKAFRCRDFIMGDGNRQVGISPDRTKEERDERKNLLTEMQERVKRGEKDLVLRNGRIVTKKPYHKAAD